MAATNAKNKNIFAITSIQYQSIFFFLLFI